MTIKADTYLYQYNYNYSYISACMGHPWISHIHSLSHTASPLAMALRWLGCSAKAELGSATWWENVVDLPLLSGGFWPERTGEKLETSKQIIKFDFGDSLFLGISFQASGMACGSAGPIPIAQNNLPMAQVISSDIKNLGCSVAELVILLCEELCKYPLVNKQFTIENGHRNRWFTHEKWWFSIVMLVYQRVIKL